MTTPVTLICISQQSRLLLRTLNPTLPTAVLKIIGDYEKVRVVTKHI
jgi:hypothetical protein